MNARRITLAICPACVTSVLHFVTGSIMRARSQRPSAILRASELPAVTTMGTPPESESVSRLMPLARPLWMCRLTKEGFPVRRA